MPEISRSTSAGTLASDCLFGAARDGVAAHLLPSLPAESLAALRQTCRSMRDMVDHGTDECWRRAARPRLSAPPPAGASALGVQAILRRSAAASRGIAGGSAPVETLALTAIAHDPSGQRLAGLGRDREVVIASSAGQHCRTADALGACDHLAWSADGGYLLAHSTERSTALRLDVATWRVDSTIEVAHFPAMGAGRGGPARAPLHTHASFSPDGRVLAYIEADERVTLHHLSSGRRRWSPAPRPAAWVRRTLAWSPDGAFVVVSRQSGKQLPGEILRADAPECPWLSFHFLHNETWSPDGRALAYYDGEKVTAMDVVGRRWMVQADRTIGARWSRDGSVLALRNKQVVEPEVVFRTSDWTRQDTPAPLESDIVWAVVAGGRLHFHDARGDGQPDAEAGGMHAATPLPPAPGALGRQTQPEDVEVRDIACCPWPMARRAAALLLSDERVVVLDIGAVAVSQVVPPISVTQDPRPAARTVLHWSKNDHTLALQRPDGLQVIDFAAAAAADQDPRTRRLGA